MDDRAPTLYTRVGGELSSITCIAVEAATTRMSQPKHFEMGTPVLCPRCLTASQNFSPIRLWELSLADRSWFWATYPRHLENRLKEMTSRPFPRSSSAVGELAQEVTLCGEGLVARHRCPAGRRKDAGYDVP